MPCFLIRLARNSSAIRNTATLVLLGLIVSTGEAADWARFRGPGGAGISQDRNIPTDWSDSKNLQWKLDLPGAGFSSPIVVGDRVFVTCYSDDDNLDDLKRHLVCVNRRTGKPEWSKVVASTAREMRIPQFAGRSGYSSHTPVSDGERVYVHFGGTGVIAYDLTGKKLWQKDVGSENRARFGSAASPILYKDQLIITAAAESESIRAFNAKTGEEIWKTEAASLNRSYSTPLIAADENGNDALLVSVAYEVWGLNPATGKLRWFAETRVDTSACTSLVAKDGIAYAVGGRSGGRTAIRIGGKDDVTTNNVLWSEPGGAYVPSPVLHDGHLYWVNDRGIASCVDIKTGQEAGRARLGGQFYASVVLINNKLYAVSRFDGTHVLEASPKLTPIAQNRFNDDSDFSGSPAVSDGQLFIRSDSTLYCIAKQADK